MVAADSMWMHFQGQMSTQPSHMMHSDWSMWRNCLGLTALESSSGAISVRVYSPGKLGIGGFASLRPMDHPSLHVTNSEPAAGHKPKPSRRPQAPASCLGPATIST